jgi:hypothetical protein
MKEALRQARLLMEQEDDDEEDGTRGEGSKEE